ncbi:hypothetical protein BU25DRAFT_417123 [Macroventuria anomochaeta]|uniref:Uncharacterized protein n=1 Tax=Macroventuria anomochaeta TaxID=301207 RepID=A0ACB6SIX4_9PLEO|nr:uncharacterized protein BU25DRAFT_417123 [Macroventuria anomochaeta]KAF2634008.1 hypothetical protein BU25DRAFT_417123 [Macroventuria anomochaeta]
MTYEPDGTASVIIINSTIPLIDQSVKRSTSPLVPRACGMGVGCDGIILNHGDCDLTVEGLKAQCGRNVNHLNYKGSIYTIAGDTMAFYYCCGLYLAGSFSDVGNKLVQKSRTYSYGYTTVEHG